MKNIDDKSIDMILCDLPYGTTACKWDIVIPFEPLWAEYNRIIKDNGCIALFGSEPFSSYLRMSNIKNYKYDWYWNKINSGGFATAKYKPLSVVEQVLIFGKRKINYYPIMEVAEEKNKRPRDKVYKRQDSNSQGMSSGEFKTSKTHNENLRYPKNLVTYNNRIGELNSLNRLHPTQKPVALFEYLIKTYTNENELILDNCMGSGTTAVACINTNRNYIGFEKDTVYCDLANKRIENALNKS